MIENAVLIINRTRLELLIERFNTRDQARFYIEHSGGDFRDYEAEHNNFHKALDLITREVSRQIRYKVVERRYLPNYIFSGKDIALVVGQDGLVANTAKYAGSIPILAVNPDPERYDGVLLPFNTGNFIRGLDSAVSGTCSFRDVTMAEVRMRDGQRLLAFNDFFIGPSTHLSARYRITYGEDSENQSSSGIIVSTGAGSTGWLSSLLNMANGLNSYFNPSDNNCSLKMEWDEEKLFFVVREPFISRYSKAGITAGIITGENRLVLESLMPGNGVIFSDGIEADYLKFNSGSVAEIGIAEQKAHIINRD